MKTEPPALTPLGFENEVIDHAGLPIEFACDVPVLFHIHIRQGGI